MSPDKAAQLVVEKTNTFRKAQGREPLAVQPSLEEAAEEFARFMAKTGKYGHGAGGRTPVERASEEGYDHCIVAENIGYVYRSTGYGTSALAEALVDGWKKSPEHRENLLDRALTQIGVGIAQDEKGRWFGVQMFGRPKAAAIRFTVTNASGEQASYSIGEREYTLPPRARRRHLECRPPELRLPSWKESRIAADGERFTIKN